MRGHAFGPSQPIVTEGLRPVSSETVAHEQGRSRSRRRELASWFGVPAVGALWAAYRLRRTYFFYDEWSMIDRVMHLPTWTGMTRSFNGHLWVFQGLLYRIQVAWFGVDSHLFVCVIFLLSLIALHVTVAMVFKGGGVPWFMSLVAAGLLTYLGAASQNFVFAVQTSPNLALAVGLSAAVVAVTRQPTTVGFALAGTMMVLSVAFDSAAALTSISFSAVVLLIAWRGRYSLAVLPSLVAMGWWYLTGDLGPVDDGSLAIKARFAVHLFLRSIGSLFAQGELAGGVILALVAATVSVGLAKGAVVGNTRAVLAAGMFSTVVTTAAIAHSRAVTVGVNFVDYNRYLQNVLIPFALAALPAVYATLRGLRWAGHSTRYAPLRGMAGPVIVGLAFLLGLSPLRAYNRSFEAWNVAVRDGVRDATAVIAGGCPSGAPPAPLSQPLGDLSPQVSTRLLQELLERGALTSSGGREVDQTVIDRMCPDSP